MDYDERYYDKVLEARECIRSIAGGLHPKTAIVLGSGLGKISEDVKDPIVIEAKDIPHWPQSTAPGHAGQVILGKIAGRSVLVLKGRVHYYEGYNMQEVTFPTRVLGMLGIRQYVATNAAGGVDYYLKPGDIVLVQDHINNMGVNPLRGPTEPRWNVRFPDMTHTYSRRLSDLCERAALESNIPIMRGTYIAFPGPSYETPAEVRKARILGASVVGMSTVPEVIVAHAMGMETAVISCVANQGAGMSDDDLTEEEILASMQRAAGRIGALLCSLMKQLEGD